MDEYQVSVFETTTKKFLSENCDKSDNVDLVILSTKVIKQTIVKESANEENGSHIAVESYLAVDLAIEGQATPYEKLEDNSIQNSIQSPLIIQFPEYVFSLQKESNYFINVTFASHDPDNDVGGTVEESGSIQKLQEEISYTNILIALGVVCLVACVAIGAIFVKKRSLSTDISPQGNRIDGEVNIVPSQNSEISRRKLTVLDSLEFSETDSSPQLSNFADKSRGSAMFPYTANPIPTSRTWDREVNQHFVSQFSPRSLMDRCKSDSSEEPTEADNDPQVNNRTEFINSSSPKPQTFVNRSRYFATQQVQLENETTGVIYPNASSLTEDETFGRTKEPNVQVCYAPSGALGLVVDSTPNGPFVHSIKPQSPLIRILQPGDFVLAVDSIDTRGMNAATLTKLMAKKAHQNQRKITFRAGNQCRAP